jgi:hypothetical protein
MSLAIQPPPTVASDLSSTYQFTPPPLLPGFRNCQLHHRLYCVYCLPSLPSSVLPCPEATPMPAQEPVLSFPSPASLGALAEHFFDGLRTPYAHSHTPIRPFPSLDRATQPPKEAPTLGWSRTSTPIAFTRLFDWTTLTGAVLPPHAEPSLITDHDGEGVPDQSERSESFELVSPPSISAVNGGGNDHVDAHAWWTDFAGLAPRFSASQTDPQCTLNSSKVKARARATSRGQAQ